LWFGLGLMTTALVALAWGTNLVAKPLATVFGGTLTLLGMLLAVAMCAGGCDTMSARFFFRAALLRLGRLVSSAVDGYYRLLSLDRRDRARIYRNLGRAQRDQGQAERAIAAYSAAVVMAPQDVESRLQLAQLYLKRGELARAVEALGRVVELQPTCAESHFSLGLGLLKQGRMDEALQCFERAVELDPGHARAHHRRGLVLSRQGQLEEAADALARAVALEPHQQRYQRHLDFLCQTAVTGPANRPGD